jgi:Flp pilus assembly protein TadD
MVALAPKNDKYHFTLGALYDENKQRSASIEEMRKTIELNPKNAQALNYLGYTYAEDGNHLDEAERLVKRALAIEPEDGFYIDSLGWVYYRKGEYGKAAEQLEKAVNLTGDDPTITEHLGDAYAKLGRAEQAGQQYEDALRRSTDQEQMARLKGKLQALRNVGSASH